MMLENVNQTHEQVVLFQNHMDEVKELIADSKRNNTKIAYRSDWNQFDSWCRSNGIHSLSANPNIICIYIKELGKQGYKLSTIRRRLASINQAYNMARIDSPVGDYTVTAAVRGLANRKGTHQQSKKPVLLNEIKLIIDTIDINTKAGKRDKALLLLGFALASRRSELVAIDVKDMEYTQGGLDVTIKQTKTDNNPIMKFITEIGGSYCPIVALNEWLESANITDGAIFRNIDRHGNIGNRLSDKSVANTVKKYAELAGLDASKYAGHSLRSGFATSAAMEGATESDIMMQLGHHTPGMTHRYVKNAKRFKNNPTRILKGL